MKANIQNNNFNKTMKLEIIFYFRINFRKWQQFLTSIL